MGFYDINHENEDVKKLYKFLNEDVIKLLEYGVRSLEYETQFLDESKSSRQKIPLKGKLKELRFVGLTGKELDFKLSMFDKYQQRLSNDPEAANFKKCVDVGRVILNSLKAALGGETGKLVVEGLCELLDIVSICKEK